jgi:septal ring factor EnvC (AmiA/AmiB activator)
MNDTELTKLLRALPRTSASPRFNSDVLRAIRQADEPRPAFTWRIAAAFAMAVCLVLVVQVAHIHQAKERQRIDALRAEQQRIETELAAVKEQASQYEPVVVLEHADGTRVVVDSTPSTPRNSDIVPASYTYN